jgi:hypothetical protein
MCCVYGIVYVLYMRYCSPLDAALVCASGGDTVRFFRVLDSEVNSNLNYLELDLSISFF